MEFINVINSLTKELERAKHLQAYPTDYFSWSGANPSHKDIIDASTRFGKLAEEITAAIELLKITGNK